MTSRYRRSIIRGSALVICSASILLYAQVAGAQPKNDQCITATSIDLASLSVHPFVDGGLDTLQATTDPDDPCQSCTPQSGTCQAGGVNARSVWYKIDVPMGTPKR